MTTHDWQVGDVVRGEPDDGRRWMYDPTDDDGNDPTPWRVDTDQLSDWIGADLLPPDLLLVEREAS